jgi:enoyl-CoA hydratase
VDGVEAQRIGLVHRAVPTEDLDAEVQRWVDEILALPPLAVGLGKRVVDRAHDTDIGSSLDFTSQIQGTLINTDDFVEGVRAKLEKRNPTFQGR